MLSSAGTTEIGNVTVVTTSHRGLSPEELAEMALARIISVGENSHPTIIAQAIAYRDFIRTILIHYLRMAQENERSNIVGALTKQGHADTADLIRRSF